LNLHAQAVAVQNIRSLIPILLDLNAGNYARWRDQFLLTAGKFSLEDHVLRDPPACVFPDWTRMDCVVKSWIYGTVSNDLADTAMERDTTARAAWLALETQFLGNRETRVLYLDAQFRQFVQGDLSIVDYCRTFKQMVAKLRDLGEHVTDRTLVLNVIRGLNDRYTALGLHLRRARPFPTFDDVCADLLMEELNLANRSSTLASRTRRLDRWPARERLYFLLRRRTADTLWRGLELRGRGLRQALQGEEGRPRQARGLRPAEDHPSNRYQRRQRRQLLRHRRTRRQRNARRGSLAFAV